MRKRRGAAGWCEENEVQPGDTIERFVVDGWVRVRVTAIGESSILTRSKGAGEYEHGDPKKLRLPADWKSRAARSRREAQS